MHFLTRFSSVSNFSVEVIPKSILSLNRMCDIVDHITGNSTRVATVGHKIMIIITFTVVKEVFGEEFSNLSVIFTVWDPVLLLVIHLF